MARRNAVRVRVRRQTSVTHQFVTVRATAIRRVDCPQGWMSPQGYTRYLRVTLAKMRARLARKTPVHLALISAAVAFASPTT
jgi:hypothetical protein